MISTGTDASRPTSNGHIPESSGAACSPTKKSANPAPAPSAISGPRRPPVPGAPPAVARTIATSATPIATSVTGPSRSPPMSPTSKGSPAPTTADSGATTPIGPTASARR